MPKLFLSSKAISDTQAPYFIELVGKKAEDIKLALIENAGDVEADPKEWMIENRRWIQSHGFDVELIDLREFQNDAKGLQNKLASKDAIWLGGGNTYYLRWLLRTTGADEMIQELVADGMVYGGGSAGAIVAGPTLKYFETADDPILAPELILEGFGLTDTVVVPHTDNPKFASIIKNIDRQLKETGYTTAPLTDARALMISGSEQKIV